MLNVMNGSFNSFVCDEQIFRILSFTTVSLREISVKHLTIFVFCDDQIKRSQINR